MQSTVLEPPSEGTPIYLWGQEFPPWRWGQHGRTQLCPITSSP